MQADIKKKNDNVQLFKFGQIMNNVSSTFFTKNKIEGFSSVDKDGFKWIFLLQCNEGKSTKNIGQQQTWLILFLVSIQ